MLVQCNVSAVFSLTADERTTSNAIPTYTQHSSNTLTSDSKSSEGNLVGVQVPPPVLCKIRGFCDFARAPFFVALHVRPFCDPPWAASRAMPSSNCCRAVVMFALILAVAPKTSMLVHQYPAGRPPRRSRSNSCPGIRHLPVAGSFSHLIRP
jgi:hypothetical protein